MTLRNIGGMHAQSYGSPAPEGPAAKQAVMTRRAGSLKILDAALGNGDEIRAFVANNPTSPVCYRRVTNDDLGQIAAYTAQILADVQILKGIVPADLLYAEIGINEQFQAGDDLSRLADATITEALKYADAGVRPVAFNFSVGNPVRIIGAEVDEQIILPDHSDIARIAEAVDVVCNDLDGCIGYHGYGLPWAWNDPWLGLRYRKLYAELLNIHGVSSRWWIGEAGVDRGIIAGRLGGWRLDEFKLTPSMYANMVRSNCRAASIDLYAIGLSFFGAGGYESSNPQANWFSFEYVDYPEILSVFAELYEIGDGGGSMPEPVVGAGYNKMIPYIGKPVENEVYHFFGTDQENSLAVFENGKATWSKRTNATIAERTSDGSIFTDRGNVGDGVTVVKIY